MKAGAVLLVGCSTLFAGTAVPADVASIDWSKIPTKNVKLFYPGQASYQWLISPAHKRGDRGMREGKSCLDCHKGEETELGDSLVKGGPLEAMPVAGKRGTIDLAVQAAHDDKNLYLRFQ